MRIKRWLCLALCCALLMMALPAGAMAAKKAKPSINLPAKVGFMPLGGSVTLRTRLKGVKAGALSFASSDESVVSVSQGGLLQARASGRAVITVSGGGARAKMGIVVVPLSVTVGVGQRVSLPYGTVEKYAVKDRTIAAISKRGVITGRKAGTTMVRLKYGSQVQTIEVKVTSGTEAEAPTVEAPAPTAVDESKAASLSAASSATQIVLVEYKSGSNATLSVHEKKDGVWQQLLETPAYVGKNGIGKTKEGDKKTPVGTYNLTTPFGIKDDPGAQMPYTKVTKYHYWCGASSSKYYNQFCDSRVNGRSCTKSDEHLIDYKGAYNYCMFIDYNAAGVAHKGSCIFLHCFSKNKYTAGCVAISEASMKKIVQWARPGVKIVIQ